MQRLLIGVLIALCLSACGTSPMNSETTREVVLQYLGGDVGTAGPFGKGGKKEIGMLSEADRRKVEDLIDRGASLFLVFAPNAANSGAAGGGSRVVLVQKGRVVGDFKAAEAPAPAATPGT